MAHRGIPVKQHLYPWLQSKRQWISQQVTHLLEDNKPKNSIASLDGVRALACLSVITYHLSLLVIGARIWKPVEPFTDAAIRKKLERARRLFADLLLEEAERLLQTTTRQSLEEGLIENAAKMGAYLLEGLTALIDKHSIIGGRTERFESSTLWVRDFQIEDQLVRGHQIVEGPRPAEDSQRVQQH